MNCTRKGYRGFPVSRVSAFNHVYVANQNNTLCIHEVILKRIPGAHISGTHCRRSSTQGNRLRESKDQLHEAI